MILVKGDLIRLADAGDFDVIVHGANCFNTMGSGIARQIRERYPSVYSADLVTVAGDYHKLGTYTQSTVNDGKLTVVNAYTQFTYNRAGQTADLFEYVSFDMILQKLAYVYPNSRFGFPLIGQGLAKGDTVRIMTSLMDFSDKLGISGGTVTVVEFA